MNKNYMKSLRNNVHYLSDNMHVPRKIYWEFCYEIVYITKEGCHRIRKLIYET